MDISKEKEKLLDKARLRFSKIIKLSDKELAIMDDKDQFPFVEKEDGEYSTDISDLIIAFVSSSIDRIAKLKDQQCKERIREVLEGITINHGPGGSRYGDYDNLYQNIVQQLIKLK